MAPNFYYKTKNKKRTTYGEEESNDCHQNKQGQITTCGEESWNNYNKIDQMAPNFVSQWQNEKKIKGQTQKCLVPIDVYF